MLQIGLDFLGDHVLHMFKFVHGGVKQFVDFVELASA